MDTKHILRPYRRRMKRAARKLAKARARPGAPPFGASVPALRSMRKATLACPGIPARIAELPDVAPDPGWEDRALERARDEGVVPR